MTARILLLHGAVILALFLLQFVASDYAVLTVTRWRSMRWATTSCSVMRGC
jgi:hypothetical protein